MKTILATLLTLVLGIAAHAETMPDAPSVGYSSSNAMITVATVSAKPSPKLGAWDYAADSAVAVTRILDYTSTRAFLTPKPIIGGHGATWVPGHEHELPIFVAKNPALLATFEAGATAFTVVGERELVVHGHKRVARTLQFAQAAATAITVWRNYEIAGRTPR